MSKLTPKYHFQEHAPLSLAQKQHLDALHHEIAQIISNTLGQLLGEAPSINFSSVEQQPFGLYKLRLTDPTSLIFVRLFPLHNYVLIQIDAPLAYAFIDQLLGGEGETPRVAHNFSNVETALIRKIGTTILKSCIPGWETLLGPLQGSIETIFFHPEQVTQFEKTTACVTIEFDVNFHHASGKISFIFPRNLFAFEKLIEPEEGQKNIEQEDIVLPVEISLGSVTISLETLERLQPGDIIELETKAGSALDILINGQKSLKGYPVIAYQKKAVTIA